MPDVHEQAESLRKAAILPASLIAEAETIAYQFNDFPPPHLEQTACEIILSWVRFFPENRTFRGVELVLGPYGQKMRAWNFPSEDGAWREINKIQALRDQVRRALRALHGR